MIVAARLLVSISGFLLFLLALAWLFSGPLLGIGYMWAAVLGGFGGSIYTALAMRWTAAPLRR